MNRLCFIFGKVIAVTVLLFTANITIAQTANADETGLYLRAYYGVAKADIDENSSLTISGTRHTGNAKADSTEPMFGVGVGLNIGNHFAIEFASDRYEGSAVVTATGRTERLDVDIAIDAYFLNLYYKFTGFGDGDRKVRPYVGVGVGQVEKLDLSYTLPMGVDDFDRRKLNDIKTTVGQAIVGVAFPMSDHVDLTLDYRYLLYVQSLALGLRYSF